MIITQVPAATSQWGLSSIIPGVPGRLGQKVNKIVIHWMDTNLAGADLVFTGKTSRKVSSHFGVEDGNVHQYVSINNTAWQAGNWLANLQSVGIEHSAQPGRDASDATYETSSQLIVALCKQLGLVPSRSLLHKHNEFSATECPGTIDLERLASRAVELWDGVPATAIVASAPVQPNSTQLFLTDLSPSQTENPEVKRMQLFLESQNLFVDQGANDGIYGPKTQAAVHVFQGKHGILATTEYGWWYDKTRAIANAIITSSTTNQL